LKLARSHRSDDLTAVWVPDEDSESLRDLVRAREAAKQGSPRTGLRPWGGSRISCERGTG
jgi:hypothetical protein